MAETTDELVARILMRTVDPTVPSPFGDKKGHLPALTTMLHRLCNNDEKKLAEAMRLIELFIVEALKEVPANG